MPARFGNRLHAQRVKALFHQQALECLQDQAACAGDARVLFLDRLGWTTLSLPCCLGDTCSLLMVAFSPPGEYKQHMSLRQRLYNTTPERQRQDEYST